MSKRLEGAKSSPCPSFLCQGRDLGARAKLGTSNPQLLPTWSQWEVGKQLWELLADVRVWPGLPKCSSSCLWQTQINMTCSPQGVMRGSLHPPTWLSEQEISNGRSGRFQGSLCTSAAAPEPPWPRGQCLTRRVSAQHHEWCPPNCSQSPTRFQEQLWVLWMAGTDLGITRHILNKKAPGEEESGGQHLYITLPPT